MGVVTILSLAACGQAKPDVGPTAQSTATPTHVSQAPSASAAAVWELKPGQPLTASSTRFTAFVSRLGCNSGMTGALLAPDVEIRTADVVLTFQVEPGDPRGGNCQGNNRVPYEVELSEPIGDRALVDGQCLPGREAEHTSFCEPDGNRWSA